MVPSYHISSAVQRESLALTPNERPSLSNSSLNTSCIVLCGFWVAHTVWLLSVQRWMVHEEAGVAGSTHLASAPASPASCAPQSPLVAAGAWLGPWLSRLPAAALLASDATTAQSSNMVAPAPTLRRCMAGTKLRLPGEAGERADRGVAATINEHWGTAGHELQSARRGVIDEERFAEIGRAHV